MYTILELCQPRDSVFNLIGGKIIPAIETPYVFTTCGIRFRRGSGARITAGRMEDIYKLFGQLPGVLEDVWVYVAFGEIDKAGQTLTRYKNSIPLR